MILGNLNAGSSSLWKEYKTKAERTHLKTLLFLHNFDQLISEPTHVLYHSSSYINSIFNKQPNLAVNCGTHSTWMYSMNIPPLVWGYKKANTESIKKSIEMVNWKTLFNNKTVKKQVSIFDETISNIFFLILFPKNLLHLIIVILLG